MKKHPNPAIKKALDFLAKEQASNGSFYSLTTKDPVSFRRGKKLHSIFPTSLILSCLNSLSDNDQARPIRKKVASFLLTQKSEYWSFNYWDRRSKEARKMPYPDDLDDTFCSLSAIWGYDQKLLRGKDLAKIVLLLTMAEKKEGGPYVTWLTPPDASASWKDVDIAVNSNIAYFLSLQDISLKNINTLVEEAIRSAQLSSPYYYSHYSVIYFISRFYRGRETEKLTAYLLSQRQPNGSWNNVLDTALTVSALCNLDCPINHLAPSIQYLLSKQKDWTKAFPFVIELIEKKQASYSGSAALTTAFVLEALEKYQSRPANKIVNGLSARQQKTASQDRIKTHHRIIHEVKKLLAPLENNLTQRRDHWIKDLLASTSGQKITLLPYEIQKALPEKDILGKDMIISLGAANALGWIAYSIYDNFYDGEGNIKDLPLANICQRALSGVFAEWVKKKDPLHPLFCAVMNKIEEANLWEISNCRALTTSTEFFIPKRLPNYQNYSRLADRSFGHALGTIIILAALGYRRQSRPMNTLLKFFNHYIIAKQLNDDAHDWEKDLKSGCLSPVVVKLIRKWQKKNKSQSISFKDDLPALKELFWYEIIVELSSDIIQQIKLARKYLHQMDYLVDKHYFEQLLNQEEKSAQKALDEQATTMEFLQSFD